METRAFLPSMDGQDQALTWRDAMPNIGNGIIYATENGASAEKKRFTIQQILAQ